MSSGSKLLIKWLANVSGGGANVTIVLYCEDTNVSGVEAAISQAALEDIFVKGPVSATNNALALYDGTTGKIVKNSDVTITNDNTKTTILGKSGDYNRIGDAGVTDHSLNSEDDLLITGELEVDGDAMFDGPTITFGINTKVHILGKITLAENAPIILDALLAGDEKWSGITEIGTMGYGATVGDLIYLAVADTKWELAKADVAATSKGKIGLVTATTSENSTCQVLLYGKMRSAAFPAFTVGAPVHISAATAGDIVVAAPTGTTDFVVRIIGYGNTAEDLFFCPDNTYVELA